MSWKLPDGIEEILTRGRDFNGISRDEALSLMHLKLQSEGVYALMETANQMSRTQFVNKGEKHLHIGVNVEPCPMDCSFCSLARKAGIFKEKTECLLVQVQELQNLAIALFLVDRL